MAEPEKKLRQMEEEMTRFEAEIAHQTANSVATPVVPATPLTGGFAFPATTAFIPHQLRVTPHVAASLPVPPGLPVYVPLVQQSPPTYQVPTAPVRVAAGPLPVQHKTVVTHVTLPTIPPATQTVSKSATGRETAKTVITAPPQMAGPTELAARAREAATAAAKSKASAVDDDVDDDVTRALLAAAAGVTYTRIQGPNGKAAPQLNLVILLIHTMAEPEKKLRQMEEEMTRFEAEIAHQTANSVATPVVPATPLTGGFAFPATTAFIPHQLRVTPHVAERVLASITKPPLTPVVPQTSPVGQQNPLATPAIDSSKLTTVLIPPPAYRPATSTTNSSVGQTTNKKKRYIRVAAGMTWVDPTLADWDPNDFRIFCGDLGNEVSDDTLARAFNRYPSFQKARVVRDKRTNKSRGYGFVSFSDPADFMRAMREMNGKYVGNRPIKLKRSDWRSRQLETHRKKEKERKKLGLKN
ncbi:uncharacterized protein DEA37_0010839 [Paragonimus westermani]|uniref:RNA-binding protein 42 n=1 Tax=Paragonimus westermani TaxID=34504 RepID=A0A5J4NVC0_9TREM|nr:uncharacterized protein DEA37_0010839 [Paragonimus westermani]